eukprot:15483113-Alexandrium_andersonii.AAC.1
MAVAAAQNAVVGLRAFRELEAKLRTLGLRRVVVDRAAAAAEIGGEASGLAKAAVPTGTAVVRSAVERAVCER